MTATLTPNCPTFDTLEEAAAHQAKTGSGVAVEAVSMDFSQVEERLLSFYKSQPDLAFAVGRRQ